MSEKEQASLENLKMKRDNIEGVQGGLLVFSAIMALTTGLTGVIGAAAHASADATKELLIDTVTESRKYQDRVTMEDKALGTKLANGEITYKEYVAKKEMLRSDKHAMEYAKSSQNYKIKDLLESYKKDKDMAEGTLKRGVPTMLAVTASSATVLAISEILRRKYDKGIKADIQQELEI